MDQNVQELLTKMSNVMGAQQEAIEKQQKEIQDLKATIGKNDDTGKANVLSESEEKNLDNLVKNFRI